MWCLWGLKFDVPYLEEAGASGRAFRFLGIMK